VAKTRAPETAKHHLEQLGAALQRRGWSVVLIEQGGETALKVTNPSAREVSELVFCRRGRGGTFKYHWPWREPIAPVSSMGIAIERIRDLLRVDDARGTR
jgi:hypothetical protein